LNLFLHIVGQREDGYHELETYFQMIHLFDYLKITLSHDRAINLTTNMTAPPQDNLVVKAAKLLQDYTQTDYGCHIALDKHIPTGAGLGGGSSNAASTLMALNDLWELNLDQDTLLKLGLSLGADVPFFIHGKNAWASGTGEQLTCPKSPTHLWFLLLKPDISCETAQIFQAPQLNRRSEPIIENYLKHHPELTFSLDSPLWSKTYNDCEPVACLQHQQIQQLCDALKHHTPAARLTGTGSVCFAPFNTQQEAESAQKELLNKQPALPIHWSHVAQSLG